jgi:PBSX family phage portal protein
MATKKSEQQKALARAIGITNVTPVEEQLTDVQKAERELVQSNILNLDDTFSDLYDAVSGMEILRPPYPLERLVYLCEHNNTLLQCISAYEVNIEGTGYTFDLKSGESLTDTDYAELQALEEFFREVYPGESFITLRRKLRVDLEKTGNAYIEVIRNVAGEIVFLNRVPSTTMRLIKLDDPVPVQRTIIRNGRESVVSMLKSERRYIQYHNNQKVFFREFGASRDLNKLTGAWAKNGERLPPNVRASEIIHLTVNKHDLSPYGLPRWINQLPSILGSRKAEELNLEFFDAGGLPPAIIAIQGGLMAPEVRNQLYGYLSGTAKSKLRAAIVEVESTSGGLDGSGGNVKLDVHKFGSDMSKDSMFEGYDDKCERRVRASFRLPPIFVGKSEDYSYASAYASYTVAEAQVFQPERQEFDEIITNTILRELNPRFELVSKPINVKDSSQQIAGLANFKEVIDPESLIDALSDITGLVLKPNNQPAQPSNGIVEPTQPEDTPTPAPTAKSDNRVYKLAEDWVGILSGEIEATPDYLGGIRSEISALTEPQREVFYSYVAMKIYPSYDIDPDGAREMAKMTTHCVLHECDHE